VGIAKSMGVPGYAPPHVYNYVAITFWTYNAGPQDVAIVWANPSNYFGTSSAFGSTDAQIRTNIKSIYNSNGIKLLVSAFGSTETPTTSNYDPVVVATSLASYVTTYGLDGVDVDWEDTAAFQAGTGEAWLITFTTTLRQKLPNAIITHAPQAPYFAGTSLYTKGAYVAVHNAVGSMIQFYNVQFYNQGSTSYNTGNSLFNTSGGWAPGTSVN
jgi:chitinase